MPYVGKQDNNEPKIRLGWWILYDLFSMEFDATNSGSFFSCPCVKEEDKDLNAALKIYFSIESLVNSGS